MRSEKKPLLQKRPEYYRRAGVVSRSLFLFVLQLLRKGQKQELNLEDIESNLDENDANFLANELSFGISCKIKENSKTPLMGALIRVYGRWFLTITLVVFVKDAVLRTLQYILLGGFIRSLNNDGKYSNTFTYGVALVLSVLAINILQQLTIYNSIHMGMKISVALSSLVYRKSLKVSQEGLAKTGVGKIQNFLSSDVGTFVYGLQILHALWIAPVTTLISAILIWSYVGVASLAGIFVTLILIPLQSFSSKWFGGLRIGIALRTDRRLHLVNEILNGILLIKISTWEVPFTEQVTAARADEIDWMKKKSVLNGSIISLLQICPKIALFLTLTIYVLQGNILDTETAFVTLTIFTGIANLSTRLLSSAIVSGAEMRISIKRIEEYLQAEEWENPNDFQILEDRSNVCPRVILKSVSTRWSKDGDNILHNLNLESTPGKFICILGAVGAGKSTLLSTILKETCLSSGTVHVEGSIAYTAQSPSLFPATVRENILFGKPMEFEWYSKVVEACALDHDFRLLPFGDETVVADKGVTLSGGQKARISLARAIYRNADIYLLDDPLASVDAAVGRHIYTKCILGVLRSKCLFLVTHLTHHTRFADEIILLDKGIVRGRGSYDELSFRGLLSLTTLHVVDDVIPDGAKLAEMDDVKGNMAVAEDAEHRPSGRVGLGLLWKYFRVGNGTPLIAMMLITAIANQFVISYSDLFLQIWTKTEESTPRGIDKVNRFWYISVYTVLMILLTILPFIRTVAHYWTCLRSAEKLHSSLFTALIRAPMRFFERNSIGKVVNRVSKDMRVGDQDIQDTLYNVLGIGLQSVGSLILVSLMNPILIVPTILLLACFYSVRKYYLQAASAISRLETTTKSPVFAHLSSSLHGLSTIRAYQAQTQFEQMFDAVQNIHSSTNFTQIVANRWLTTTIQFIAFIYFTIVTLSFTFAATDKASAGLAVSSILTLSGLLALMLSESTNLENQLVSVERILEYAKIKPEPEFKQKPFKTSRSYRMKSWPQHGGIRFDRVRVSYIPGQDVLHSITLTIKPTEKIGIVGRTGTGKSTLISSLFRIVELNSGTIHIDGVDISQVGLHDLRSKIALIPQDPILFSGTLRKNLDPFSEHEDYFLHAALTDTNLNERVAAQGLETLVAEHGKNFSHGQRQLISLARAMLKKPKIIVLDEATAHVDTKTDLLIQKLVKEKFSFCTVLTIAHRLETILDSDRVCVVEAGRIAEFDAPTKLLQDTTTRLYSFVNTAKFTQ